MDFYRNKNILVTGGTGLIGRPLVEMLLSAGARVTTVSLDDPSRAPAGAEFVQADLREFSTCCALAHGKDIVFHLAGVKGSPAMTAKRPASFFVPTLQFSINMMEAARRAGVSRYLYTSSVGVYAPASVFHEDEVWKSFPSPHDKFAGWAKRMGELQAEAFRLEYGWEGVSIVRPANVYGPYDNFDPAHAMVIPSLMHRVCSGESPLSVWGDGTPVRDFIHARDVARAMMQVIEQGITEPLNLGSGCGVSIREVAETIAELAPGGPIPIVWDKDKPSGDAMRIMDTARARAYGIAPSISLHDGLKETLHWYLQYREGAKARYNAFDDPALKGAA